MNCQIWSFSRKFWWSFWIWSNYKQFCTSLQVKQKIIKSTEWERTYYQEKTFANTYLMMVAYLSWCSSRTYTRPLCGDRCEFFCFGYYLLFSYYFFLDSLDEYICFYCFWFSPFLCLYFLIWCDIMKSLLRHQLLLLLLLKKKLPERVLVLFLRVHVLQVIFPKTYLHIFEQKKRYQTIVV